MSTRVVTGLRNQPALALTLNERFTAIEALRNKQPAPIQSAPEPSPTEKRLSVKLRREASDPKYTSASTSSNNDTESIRERPALKKPRANQSQPKTVASAPAASSRGIPVGIPPFPSFVPSMPMMGFGFAPGPSATPASDVAKGAKKSASGGAQRVSVKNATHQAPTKGDAKAKPRHRAKGKPTAAHPDMNASLLDKELDSYHRGKK